MSEKTGLLQTAHVQIHSPAGENAVRMVWQKPSVKIMAGKNCCGMTSIAGELQLRALNRSRSE